MQVRVIEIGGTKTKRADVSLKKDEVFISNLKTLLSSEIPSPKSPAFFKFVVGDGFKKETKCLVFAVAGLVKNHEIVEVWPNLAGWPKNFNLADFSQKQFKIPVFVFNDMETAVFGMAYLLKKEGYKKPFWGITWSSGIGGRFWDGQKIVSNSEIGHITTDFSKKATICSCGKKGHIEGMLGGKAIEKQFKARLSELDKAYKNGEKWAVKFYQEKAKIMGVFLANLILVNRAELICFKGTVAEHALKLPGIKKEMIKTIKNSVISTSWANLNIRLSPDGEKDSLIGAALAVRLLLK